MSTQLAILNAVKAVLDAASPALGLSVYVKKQFLVGKDEAPCVIVTPNKTVVREQQYHNVIWYGYVIDFAVIQPGNRLINTTLDDVDPYVDRIAGLLHTSSLSGVSSVWDTDYIPGSSFQVRGLMENYDRSDFQIVFYTSEPRQS